MGSLGKTVSIPVPNDGWWLMPEVFATPHPKTRSVLKEWLCPSSYCASRKSVRASSRTVLIPSGDSIPRQADLLGILPLRSALLAAGLPPSLYPQLSRCKPGLRLPSAGTWLSQTLWSESEQMALSPKAIWQSGWGLLKPTPWNQHQGRLFLSVWFWENDCFKFLLSRCNIDDNDADNDDYYDYDNGDNGEDDFSLRVVPMELFQQKEKKTCITKELPNI
jgi:hypothetical protein